MSSGVLTNASVDLPAGFPHPYPFQSDQYGVPQGHFMVPMHHPAPMFDLQPYSNFPAIPPSVNLPNASTHHPDSLASPLSASTGQNLNVVPANPPVRAVSDGTRTGTPVASNTSQDTSAVPSSPAVTDTPEANPAPATSKPSSRAGRGRAKSASRGGRGAKSGSGNRREHGESDDEIGKLDSNKRASAAVVAPPATKTKAPALNDAQKLYIVNFICSEGRYQDVKLKLATYCNKISQVISGATDTQISNYWGSVVQKYKACRALDGHTGGGDGDEEDRGEEVENKDKENAEVQDGGEDSEAKQADGNIAGRRCVNGTFSRAVLDAFRESKQYELINKVASDDPSIVRKRDYNSMAHISDDESDIVSSVPASPVKKRSKQDLKDRKATTKKGKVVRKDQSEPELLTARVLNEMVEQRRAKFEFDKQRLELERQTQSHSLREKRMDVLVDMMKNAPTPEAQERATKALEEMLYSNN